MTGSVGRSPCCNTHQLLGILAIFMIPSCRRKFSSHNTVSRKMVVVKCQAAAKDWLRSKRKLPSSATTMRLASPLGSCRGVLSLSITTSPHQLQALRPSVMASKSICSRCLRLAIFSRPRPSSSTSRAFSTTPLKQPSRQDRGLHSSSKRRLASAEPQTRSNLEDGYIHPLSREAGQPSKDAPQPSLFLGSNDLFNSFTKSPSPHIRKRAAVIRQNAYCPHPNHQATRAATSPIDAEVRKTGAMPPAHVRYECPDCGIPVSCSFEHFASDYEDHLQLCDTLRQINEDDHDLVSGRMFPEFEMPGPQLEEAQVNMTNWDTLLYTREFEAVNDERPMRQVTRLLTYPITIGSILHELSPYSLRDQLTPEGLRSLTGRLSDLYPLFTLCPH